jgi:oxaloacetate decarboxylase (Na+ extruding) subunit alpha
LTRLVDTTLRLLGQEPLAGQVPTGRILDLARDLDRVGFHALEVSGGGCFRAAVSRGVESPWERIRLIRRRVTDTPLAMALRGTFLVGARPVATDLVRRFILCAAESGIDIFRLHDPLNDADDLEHAAAAIREAGARLYAGLVYADAPGGDEFLLARARRLVELGADRIMLHDPAGQLDPAGAARLVTAVKEASGVPVGLYCQGSGGTALAVALEASRAGADPVATAAFPVAIGAHRPSAELVTHGLASVGIDTGVDRERLWAVAQRLDQQLGSADAAPRLSPHVSLLAALNRVNAGLIAYLERRLAANDASDRLAEVLDEFHRVRTEVGSPPTASPVGTLIVRQAIDHVLSGRRWTQMTEELRQLVLGEWGQTPGPIDAAVAAVAAAQPAAADATLPGLAEARAEADGIASSDEELCLLALFGDEARALLARVRGRDRPLGRPEASDPKEHERIRSLIQLLEESDAAELTVQEGQTRITVRKHEEPAAPAAAAPGPAPEPASTGLVVASPMVGSFYRAPSPDEPPFVEIGSRVEIGQTLCLLEAMKLFNELKSDHTGIIRRILATDGSAVEYGQPLFELEPV